MCIRAGHHELTRLGYSARPEVAEEGMVAKPLAGDHLYFV